MNYSNLIEKIGEIAKDKEMLISVNRDKVFIHAECFSYTHLNKIQRLLQLYGECEWWILPSNTLENSVMYEIHILNLKDKK